MIDDILDLAREDYLPAHAKAYKGALERAAIELRRLTTHDGPCDCDLCRSSRIVARQTEAIKGLTEKLAAAERVVAEVRRWAGNEARDSDLYAALRAYDEGK